MRVEWAGEGVAMPVVDKTRGAWMDSVVAIGPAAKHVEADSEGLGHLACSPIEFFARGAELGGGHDWGLRDCLARPHRNPAVKSATTERSKNAKVK